MLSSVELSQFLRFLVFLGKFYFIKKAQKGLFFGSFFQNVGTAHIVNYNTEQ